MCNPIVHVKSIFQFSYVINSLILLQVRLNVCTWVDRWVDGWKKNVQQIRIRLASQIKLLFKSFNFVSSFYEWKQCHRVSLHSVIFYTSDKAIQRADLSIEIWWSGLINHISKRVNLVVPGVKYSSRIESLNPVSCKRGIPRALCVK